MFSGFLESIPKTCFFSQKLPKTNTQNLGIPNIFSDNFLGESPPLTVGLKRRTEALKRETRGKFRRWQLGHRPIVGQMEVWRAS